MQVKLPNGDEADVSSAAGVKGVLISLFGGGYAFRVYDGKGGFEDYDIKHNDLEVTISEEELASFYKYGDAQWLDHSPEVLGYPVKGGG